MPLKSLLSRLFRRAPPADADPAVARARQLIVAIDAGGIPLDPRRITRIAEDLGLEVSRKASSTGTIERIRTALARHDRH